MAKAIKHEACPRCRANGKDRRGDNCAVYSDGGKHCFSCGYHLPATAFHRWTVKDDHHGSAATESTTLLPRDFTREVPGKAWQWLLQFGLGPKYWQPFVGWSESHSRLVFPQGDFSIGRYFGEPDKRKPKWRVWGDDKRKPLIFGDSPTAPCVVLVEDLISAHKVGQVALAIPLFGTGVWDAVVPVLRHIGLPIVMWLDQDQEQHARKRATRVASLTGLPTRYVFTKDDPKKLGLDVIKQTLSGD